MLVLSRKVGEQIAIGEDAVVYVKAIEGNRVVIGIAAPRSTRILRGELHARNGSIENLDSANAVWPVGAS